jgi:hypothetical protein
MVKGRQEEITNVRRKLAFHQTKPIRPERALFTILLSTDSLNADLSNHAPRAIDNSPLFSTR